MDLGVTIDTPKTWQISGSLLCSTARHTPTPDTII